MSPKRSDDQRTNERTLRFKGNNRPASLIAGNGSPPTCTFYKQSHPSTNCSVITIKQYSVTIKQYSVTISQLRSNLSWGVNFPSDKYQFNEKHACPSGRSVPSETWFVIGVRVCIGHYLIVESVSFVLLRDSHSRDVYRYIHWIYNFNCFRNLLNY